VIEVVHSRGSYPHHRPREHGVMTNPPTVEHRSFCRICNAMCGIVVTTDGDAVIRVRGDAEHPLSRGYACPKGRALGALHHDPRRLNTPLVGRAGARRRVGWDEMLDDLAMRVHDAIDAYGPDSVAMYLASGSAFDTAGRRAAERFLRVLGSRQKYTATTIDTPSKPLVAELVGGWSGLTPVWDHERSSLLLLFGSNPVVSHGHSNAMPDPINRLRDHQRRGGTIWVVDPRRTETAVLADHALQIRPSTDWLLLGWLVRELLPEPGTAADLALTERADGVEALRTAVASFDLERITNETGLAASEVTALLDAIRGAGRVSALTGTGVSMSATANVTEWLLWALHIVTDSYDAPGGMWFNPGYLLQLDQRQWDAAPPEGSARPNDGPPSRPSLPRRFDEWPCAGLVSEIEAGNVRALFVVGGNPVTAWPDARRTVDALTSLETLVVLDVLPTETTELATHLLPSVGQLERGDLTWLLDNYQLAVAAQQTAAVVEPVAERKPMWWVFGQLGERLGIEVLGRGVSVDDVDERTLLAGITARSRDGIALVEHDTAVVHSGAVFGWVTNGVLPDRRWRLAPPALLAQLDAVLGADATNRAECTDASLHEVFVLVPHRQLRTMNSQLRDIAAPGARTDSVAVLVHPERLAALGGTGQAVTVESAFGATTGVLRGDDRLHVEAVAIAHGWSPLNVSALTSAELGIDELTGMVWQSGVPVKLRPAPLAD
jgi:anaerobic selenocysteine-containing dehydrogenase